MNLFKKNKTEINELSEKVIGLESMINDKDSEISNLMEQVKNFDFEKSELVSELSAMKNTLADNEVTINELKGQLQEATRNADDFDNKVAKASVEQIAAIGHTPIELEVNANEPVMDVVKQFKSLRGKEAVAFFEEHKKEIRKALSK